MKEWEWDDARLAMLDNRANWKIDQVREAHNELLDAMMQSYRCLLYTSLLPAKSPFVRHLAAHRGVHRE